MRFFGCDGCDARKEGLEVLQAERKETIEILQSELTEKNKQIETLTKRLTEIADPGIDRRLRQPRPIGPLAPPIGAKPVPGVTHHNDPGANYPGYERERPVGPPQSYEVE